MGCGACKTSHFGKNTLKNRRFLESNNADSGEGVRGLPKALVKMPKRCRVRTGPASPAVCRPVSAVGAAVSSLLLLEVTPFTQQPHICIRNTCFCV